MNRLSWLFMLGLAGLAAMAPRAQGQASPYIGFVYPAGGQRGITTLIELGGQRLDGVHDAIVSGEGVQAKLVDYHPKLSNQEMTLLRDQLKKLKPKKGEDPPQDWATRKIIANLEKRIEGWVNRPACSSLSDLAFVEVTMAPDAKPGARDIRLVTQSGVSNPLVFHVGQLPEFTRKAMKTSTYQVLGKEELALRKRPPEEAENGVELPCIINGQVASGEVNRYRFEAHKGQRLVISVNARELIPYIADAVPGWFQPVIALFDADGKEVAFNDDYRFNPDPTIYYETPKDGEYVLAISDAIYRGREDFIYRITVSERPFVTSTFPLGGQAGRLTKVAMRGWNLRRANLILPPESAKKGVYLITAEIGKPVSQQTGANFVSNQTPFALGTLPESFDKEPNNDLAHAQRVRPPIIINGHINRPDDWDVFKVGRRAREAIVVEVQARRLDSPVDSFLKLTDAAGKVVAFNDDWDDLESGVNTHHADSRLMVKVPATGDYYIHLGDTARNGGVGYAYRLRISDPRPDFALRVAPSSINLRSKGSGSVTVYAIRKEGFTGPIEVRLKDPATGFSSSPVTMSAEQGKVKLTVKTSLQSTERPVSLTLEGEAKIKGHNVTREAVPAEDRMQAFLWRHLVPANELKALVYDPSYKAPPKRDHPPTAPAKKPVDTAEPATDAPKFTKRQVASRLKQLNSLYQEWLLTDEFYDRKVAECESSL